MRRDAQVRTDAQNPSDLALGEVVDEDDLVHGLLVQHLRQPNQRAEARGHLRP
jgi:hypothetical protein